MPTIDPTMLARGPEWSVGGLDGATEAGPPAAGGASFGDVMTKQVASLAELQSEAAGQAQAVALGQAEDPSAAVLAVERARLSMQLAVSVRSKVTDAFTEVMRTQV